MLPDKKFSIIIPHRNTPKLLSRCLTTIPVRDDLEIIIVDDNSDPQIVDFSHFPGQNREDTIVIFTKEGRGAGYARNEGLRQATGNWVYFVDADDYLSDNFDDILTKYSIRKDLDMVFLNAKAVNEKGIESHLIVNRFIKNYNNGRPMSLKVLRYMFWSPWSRLIWRRLLTDHNIQFEEVPVSNDAWAILNASYLAKRIAVESEPCYYYYKPAGGSQTHHAYNIESDLIRLDQRIRINQLYRKAQFPFQWPIKYSFKRLFKESPLRAKQVMNEYSLNTVSDNFQLVKYLLGKLLKII